MAQCSSNTYWSTANDVMAMAPAGGSKFCQGAHYRFIVVKISSTIPLGKSRLYWYR